MSRRTHRSTYECWANMKTRCNNPKYEAWYRYGGRGIRVCPRWDIFENFLADMGPQPDSMTIERIYNDGHYEPSNCRWATRREQALNRSSSKIGTVDGLTMCAKDWAKHMGVSFNAFQTKSRKVGVEAAVRFYQTKQNNGGIDYEKHTCRRA